MTEVAIRNCRWGSLDVYHEIDENGDPTCRLRNHDVTFRTEQLAALDDGIEKCAYCAEEDVDTGSVGSMAEQLKDPEFGPEQLGLSPVEGQ